MAIRERIFEVSANSEKLSLYRRALAHMQSRTDDRGYEFFAGLHGLPLPSYCAHGNDVFLPWHRAYLYYFELALQTRLGPNFTIIRPEVEEFANVGVTWWDWASDRAHIEGIPPAYRPITIGGTRNPLSRADIGWDARLVRQVRAHPRLQWAISRTGRARTVRNPDSPDELPRQSSVNNLVMAERTYVDFNRALEQIHGDIHVWVGGSMGEVPTAAYDPIFWSHHAMIDRQWYLWQLSQNGEHPRANVRRRTLQPFPMTVEDTLDIDALGVEYAVNVVNRG